MVSYCPRFAENFIHTKNHGEEALRVLFDPAVQASNREVSESFR